AFPDSLATLLSQTDYVGPEAFVCTAVTPYWTPAPTTQQVITSITTGKYSDHVYLGKGLTDKCPPNTILAHDNPLNWSQHGGGMSILFANGEARHLEKQDAAKVLKALQAGQNPPPPGT